MSQGEAEREVKARPEWGVCVWVRAGERAPQ